MEIRSYYNDNFYIYNDAGHRIDHADDVYSEMSRLNKELGMDLNEDIIFMTAYVHDIFTHHGRKDHHTKSYDYVLANSDIYLNEFEPDELRDIAIAVSEHRASGKDHYSNGYSRLIRLADKGQPDLESILVRAYKYNAHKVFNTPDEIYERVLKHIIEKFGRTGYGFKSVDYREVYGSQLEAFWDRLDTLTLKDVKTIINKNI